jgi:hypothetical protein
VGKPPSAQRRDCTNIFACELPYTTDTTYEEIQIKDSVLKFTSLSETSQQRIQKEAARSVESKRFWTDDDLVSKRAALSRQRLQDLVNLIRRCGFIELEESYGGNGPGGRHYPETISISSEKLRERGNLQTFPRRRAYAESLRDPAPQTI